MNTKVVKGNSHPLWDEQFAIPVNVGVTEVIISVEELRNNTSIGQVRVPIESCTPEKSNHRSRLMNGNNLRLTSQLTYSL